MDENVGNSTDYIEKSNPFECGFDSFKQSNRSINHFNWLLITKLYFNNNVKEEKEGFGVWLVSNDYYYYLQFVVDNILIIMIPSNHHPIINKQASK